MIYRYQVFTKRDTTKPTLSSPWYWLATMYVVFFLGDGDYCRIVDAEREEIKLEWERAARVEGHDDT